MSVGKSCGAAGVTKRRQEARLGTGMYVVDESSPQIQVMGNSQHQHPSTPLARKNKTKVEVNQPRDRYRSLRGTRGTPDRTKRLIQYTTSVYKIAASYVNFTVAPQSLIMWKLFLYDKTLIFFYCGKSPFLNFRRFPAARRM
jgi:hypothetical protein